MNFMCPVQEQSARCFFDQQLECIMSQPVFALYVHADLSMIENKFTEHGVQHLPIINADNHLVGVVSRRRLNKTLISRHGVDGQVIYSRRMDGRDSGSPVSCDELNRHIREEIMEQQPTVLKAESKVSEAVALMMSDKTDCIVITNILREVVGIVTRSDIIKFINRKLNEIETTLDSDA